ncbi:AAA family ATPase [Texcoconibacillus texcoconensis]|uniref:Pilus assembly protein CpaE n=1 Tax=Texcoconibacillus texcoconensis TaxID=1095777 RepID=A0A840QQ66_9BACI|nr:AAA family ATPase [Texcoconibacillus texcoconensis]MBB5173481.1 pilus assembly protein CpaE [Texcoconibacillus texcoconensis]
MKVKWHVLSEKESEIEPVKVQVRKTGRSVKYFSTEKNFKRQIHADEAAVIFLHEGFSYDVYDLCGELSYKYPLTAIVLITDDIDYRKAMYVGAVDTISLPLQDEDIRQAMDKATSVLEYKMENLPEEEKEEKEGKIVTVCSTKGGVGKTTISVNLAVSLAKEEKSVAIVDLDLQFGDVSISLDVQPKKTIYDWIKEVYETERQEVLSYMTKHSSGVEVMPAPTLPEFADIVTGEIVSHLLERLQKEYDFIIIDTPPALIETTLVALEQSDEIFLITSMDLPTIKNGKLAIDTLDLLGLKGRIKVVLNRDAEMEGMNRGTVENILGMSIYSRIPSDYKVVVSSLNQGNPFVIAHPRSSLSKSIEELSNKLTDKDDEKENKKGLFKRLFKKSK